MVSEQDRDAVEELLGRRTRADFHVVVRRVSDGSPVVIQNAPLLVDGTPMPTTYWLVGREESQMMGRLESDGGVNRAEAEIDDDELRAAHDRYAAARDIELGETGEAPRPFGGVGGTRVGVKCLHAHLANWLVDGVDPVGRWAVEQLAEQGIRLPETIHDTTARHDG